MAAADQSNDLELLARRTLMDLLVAELEVSAGLESLIPRRLAFRGIRRRQPSSILQNLLTEIATNPKPARKAPTSDSKDVPAL